MTLLTQSINHLISICTNINFKFTYSDDKLMKMKGVCSMHSNATYIFKMYRSTGCPRRKVYDEVYSREKNSYRAFKS